MAHGRTGTVEPTPDLLGENHPGDYQQGVDVSTSQLGNVNVSLTEEGHRSKNRAKRVASQSTWENFVDNIRGSLGAWLCAIVALVVVKVLSEKAGDKSEFSTVRIGLENWFIVGLLAITFIFSAKVGIGLVPSDSSFWEAIREFVGVV